MIRARNLRKIYGPGRREVLRGIDLSIDAGELAAITGRSGSGKTTLLNLLGGLDTDYDGEVEIDGTNLKRLSDRELSDYRNRRIGFVFQAFHLIEHLGCLENVALPARFARGDQKARSRTDALAHAKTMLERVGLGDKVGADPSSLSGGEKQRVAIARALFNSPALLLCDEPTGNLDESTAQAIIEIFLQLNREERITVIIVSHDRLVEQSATRVIRLRDGVLHDDVSNVPRIQEAP